MSSDVPGAPRLPLFYHDPRLLSSEQHASWSLRDGDFAFASETPFVPAVVGEFVEAMRFYPIVFAAGDLSPVVVLGLEQGNLFVMDGSWDPATYVPAYVRRYPFGFVDMDGRDGFALVIDVASNRVDSSGGEGRPLFEDGKPSERTREALALCDLFQGEMAATADFVKALKAKDLLVDRHADVTLPDGRKAGVTGFQIVDEQRFSRLDAGTIVEWHNKGWLALVHFHLASLGRLRDLLARQGVRRGALPDAAASEPNKTKNSGKSGLVATTH